MTVSMPPDITIIGKLLACLKRGELHGEVKVGTASKNVATRNLNALRALRQRAKGHLTAELLERWIRQVLDADDCNISLAGVLNMDLRGFIDALDEVTAKGNGNRQRSPAGRTTKQAIHSDDFRSVVWYGTQYTFTENQAPRVKLLWQNWERGTPDVGRQILLDAASDSTGEHVCHVFRNCPAWRTMIVSAKKGSYRLQEPGKPTPTTNRAPSKGKFPPREKKSHRAQKRK
jgi:hypothetical protein